jgi:hypothetical protein
MASHFTKGYTSLLRVIPASRSALPASEKEQQTPDTFGRILKESFRQLDLFGASSRTSQDTLQLDTPQFTEAYEIWVTKLRLDCLLRRKSARLTRENDCLSWRTPDAGSKGNVATPTKCLMNGTARKDQQIRLADQVNWRTPVEQPAAIKMDKLTGELGKRMYHKETGRLAQYGLEQQVNWPTPTSMDSAENLPHREITWRGKSPRIRSNQGVDGQAKLMEIAGLLAPDSPSTNGKSQGLWRTPSSDAEGGRMEIRSGCNARLKLRDQTKGKLNPDWVEQLMGLPVGWTDCDYSVTG